MRDLTRHHATRHKTKLLQIQIFFSFQIILHSICGAKVTTHRNVLQNQAISRQVFNF